MYESCIFAVVFVLRSTPPPTKKEGTKYNIPSHKDINKLRKNKSLNTTTLNDLCSILDWMTLRNMYPRTKINRCK